MPSGILYRFYGADQALLYIGITSGISPTPRWRGHCDTPAEWWQLAAFVSVVRIAGDYSDLLATEKAAIRAEKPRFNKQHTKSRSSFMVFTREGPAAVIEQFRQYLLPEDFHALATAFAVEAQTTQDL
jgi:hypothetical protein